MGTICNVVIKRNTLFFVLMIMSCVRSTTTSHGLCLTKTKIHHRPVNCCMQDMWLVIDLSTQEYEIHIYYILLCHIFRLYKCFSTRF